VDPTNSFYYFDLNATEQGQYQFTALYKERPVDTQIDSVIVKHLPA